MVRSPRPLFRIVSAYWLLVPSKGPSCHQGTALPERAPVFDRSARAVRRAPLPRTGAHLRRRSAPGVVKLAAETESLDQRAVALHVLLLQVAQQPTTAADELEQSTLGVEVVLVDLHVFGQVTDAPAEQRDLDLGRPRVAVAGGVVVDDLLLDGVVERHAVFSWCHPAPGLYRLSMCGERGL